LAPFDISGFSRQYARARDLRCENWANEIIEIAEDGSNDWVEREVGRGRAIKVVNRESVERFGLRIDARKWLLSKLKPERYGERPMPASAVQLNVEMPGAADALRERIDRIAAKIRAEGGTGAIDGSGSQRPALQTAGVSALRAAGACRQAAAELAQPGQVHGTGPRTGREKA
jgi:hypothetical protein